VGGVESCATQSRDFAAAEEWRWQPIKSVVKSAPSPGGRGEGIWVKIGKPVKERERWGLEELVSCLVLRCGDNLSYEI